MLLSQQDFYFCFSFKEIFFFLYHNYFFFFLWRRESKKETSTLPKAPPYMEGMQPLLLSLRH